MATYLYIIIFIDNVAMNSVPLCRVLVNLVQSVGTIYNICKVRSSNLGHHKKMSPHVELIIDVCEF